MKYVKDSFVTVPNKHVLKGMSPMAQSIFFWICSFADGNGKCFPSRKMLAELTASSTRSVDRAIVSLEEIGILKKEARTDGNGQTSNLYQIHVVGEGGRQKEHTPLDKNDTGPLDKNDTRIQSNINSIQLTRESTRFEEFWKHYPKKENKMKSRNLWKSKGLDSRLEEILDFVERAKLTDRWRREFIKAPDVFLRNESWTDDLAAYSDGKKEITSRTYYV